MRILHVSQGMPPFRVGGLTKYCVDLMCEQVKQGHQVSLIYPGSYSVGKTRIKKQKINQMGIVEYKIINPLPMALVFGINKPSRYIKECASKCYKTLLKKEKFDVIHIHCIMGIHREFFLEAKKNGIPMIFTTHDYYAFCPRCILLKDNQKICRTNSPTECRECNAGKGLSKKQEIVMQSGFYEKYKYSVAMTKIRKILRNKIKNTDKDIRATIASVEEYGQLHNYNRSILYLMNLIHCNSHLTEQIFRSYEPNLNYQTVSITSSNMPKKVRHIVHKEFSITYLGGPNIEKGFTDVMEAVSELDDLKLDNWKLYLYGGQYEASKINDRRIRICGGYKAEDLKRIFQNTDVVIVYSRCYETFGFVVEEALSAGIPVIVSDRVGAKELVTSAPVNLIVPAITPHKLSKKLVEVKEKYPTILQWAQNLKITSMSEHCKEIEILYKETINQ